MPINETSPAKSLVVNTDEISMAEIQNRFGAKHDTIRDITPGRYLTILAVETDVVVDGDSYSLLDGVLKEQFGVRAMQTVFAAQIPEQSSDDEVFNVHIMGHLRVENENSPT